MTALHEQHLFTNLSSKMDDIDKPLQSGTMNLHGPQDIDTIRILRKRIKQKYQ